jgi:hypothetical protein
MALIIIGHAGGIHVSEGCKDGECASFSCGWFEAVSDA